MHETDEDIEHQERIMGAFLERVLSRTPMVPTGWRLYRRPTVKGKVDHDYDVWLWHLHIGAVEVKRRTKYATAFFEKNGWTVARDKLRHLIKMQKRGFHSLFLFEAGKDGRMFYVTIETILANRDRITPSRPEVSATTNHGKDRRQQPTENYDIPHDLFREVPQ